jgi:hypothetical protein
MLKLALKHGWQPLGSVLPELPSMDFFHAGFSAQDRDYDLPWQEALSAAYRSEALLDTYLPFPPEDGKVHTVGYRLVLLEDALNFVDALDKAYQTYEPVRVPASYFLFEPDDPALRLRPSLGALSAAIEVCAQGSFSIEPWRSLAW